MKTVYRVFDRFDQAEQAMNALATAGLPASQVAMLSGTQVGGKLFPVDVPGIGQAAANARMRDLLRGSGGASGMRGALLGLGVSPAEIERCADEVRRGRTLEAIVVEDNQAKDASDILSRYTAERSNDRPRERAEAAIEIVVPVVREELEVGTREIDAGGVRIASRVREVPVEQTVTIREERVTVERRLIDRPIGENDEALRDRSFDVRAMAEEPFITKRARVTEQIRVHKDRDERTARVNEILRHTDVRLADLPSERVFDATKYREHFAKTYGDRYDLAAVAPAYEFGERLQKSGADNEARAKATWERSNPGTWDRFKDAILTAWKKR